MNTPLLPDAKVTKATSSYRPRKVYNYGGRSHPARVTKILSVWHTIPEDERAHSSQWYWRARTWAENMATKYDAPLATVVGIVAALSPSCNWERNKQDAEHILGVWFGYKDPGKWRCTTYKRNVAKAEAIANGAPIQSTLAPKPRRSGMKCLAFYKSIMEPWLNDSVVIDRHALAIAHGAKYEKSVTYRRYKDFQAAYYTAARKVKVSVNELQAAVWCAWRERGL